MFQFARSLARASLVRAPSSKMTGLRRLAPVLASSTPVSMNDLLMGINVRTFASATSPYGNVTIPDIPLTEYIFENSKQYGDKVAFIDGTSGRTITYNQLTDGICSASQNLKEDGFTAGDVMGIHLPNCPEYGIAFHAVAMLGGANTTVNPLYTVEELNKQLRDSHAKFLLTAAPLKEVAEKAIEGTEVKKLYVLGDECFVSRKPSNGVVSTVLQSVEYSNLKEQVIALPYSSGTSGRPKGVMLSHSNLVANVAQVSHHPDFNVGFTKDDTTLGILPFFHIYGMIVVMNAALRAGSTIVTLPKFEPETFLKAMQEYKVSFAPLVPPILLFLAKHPVVQKFDLSSLKNIFSGAAPLDAQTQLAVRRRFPHCTTRQGYGMTELSPVSHFTHEKHNREGSVGYLAPNCECRIVSPETGKDVESGEVGELWIRGPNVMLGYLGNAEATAETLDSDGYLHTGDLGYVDKEGFYYVVDRLKELIKVKGFQVAPAELEGILLEHPELSDAAVIGINDERSGEAPKAYVVRAATDAGAKLTADDVKNFVKGRVTDYKHIAEVEFIDAIPKSAAGKILRRVLVAQHRQENASN